MEKRNFLKNSALAASAALFGTWKAQASPFAYTGEDWPNSTSDADGNLSITENAPFKLPALGYSFDALEPHIDAKTMEIHYTKHHQAYVDKLNAAIKGKPEEGISLEAIVMKGTSLPDAIRNNAGGHYNHSFFWRTLANKGASHSEPEGKLATAINKAFGSSAGFREQFTEAAKNRFGSGWAWLVLTDKKELAITSTANQDNPVMAGLDKVVKGTPILGLDVWEHAYYLKYQNKRPDYVIAYWNVLNWAEAEATYVKAHAQ